MTEAEHSRWKVVVLDHAFDAVDRERAVAARAGAHFAEFQCTDEHEALRAARDADVVLVNFAPVTRRVLAGLAPGARVVRYGVGVDNVDVDASRALGVGVANVPDYGVRAVADHAVTLLLALLRRIPWYDAAVREHGWVPAVSAGPLRGFSSTTVGLVGTGNIGLAVADRLRPFGFELLAHDPYADPDRAARHGLMMTTLPDLWERVHAVTLHVPATPETHHLVDSKALARMQPGAVLVNTSRGPLVDTEALVDALRVGRLAGAGLDVFEDEPLPSDSPLRSSDGVLLTPHAAFYSDDSIHTLQRLAAEEVERALAGRPMRSPVVGPTGVCPA